MKWRERCVPLETRKYFTIDQDWPIVVGSAVHNAMANCNRINGALIPQPSSGHIECGSYIRHLIGAECTIDRGFAF